MSSSSEYFNIRLKHTTTTSIHFVNGIVSYLNLGVILKCHHLMNIQH